MSGRCVESIRNVSGRCLEDVWVWRVNGGGLKGLWNKNPHLISNGRKGPMCLEGV